MKEIPTKPYVLRALFEWCVDNGYTPHLAVKVDSRTQVPPEYVKGGEITLNISPNAVHKLQMGNELIEFSARFGGLFYGWCRLQESNPRPTVYKLVPRYGVCFRSATCGACPITKPTHSKSQRHFFWRRRGTNLTQYPAGDVPLGVKRSCEPLRSIMIIVEGLTLILMEPRRCSSVTCRQNIKR